MPRSGNSSLKEIARASGVSIASVSRILRGKDQCAADTRERVHEAARLLRYRPNLLVQGIQTGQTRTIGCILCFREEFGGRIAAGVHDELVAADYVPIFLWPSVREKPTEPTNELEQIHRLLDRRVDGVILRPNHDGVNDNYLREIWERGIPLVTVDRELEHTHADFVGTDDEAGGRLAAAQLLGLGHRVLGHVAGPDQITTSRLRRLGFETAGAVAGARVLVEVDPSFGGVATPAAARRLLARVPAATAVFCANDYQAAVLYEAAAEAGLRIPQDLSVIGFADLAVCQHLRPSLSTVRQDPEEIGRQAARCLLARLRGGAPAPGSVRQRLAPTLMRRESVAPPAVAAGAVTDERGAA